MSTPHPTPTTGRRLVRRTDDSMLGGVCSGIADYLGVDPTVIRLAAVASVLFGFGAPVLAYLVAWVVIPRG